MKAYQFRLYPNKEQEEKLTKTFDLCRFTYNKLLEQLNKEEKINRSEIQHSIIGLKEKYPELNNVYSKTLQYECYRLFSNLKSLSKLKKKGNKVGRLRFKGKKWFKTIQFNQSGYRLIKTNKRKNRLHLSKIGEIKIMCHRKTKGNIKQITIKRTTDKWHAITITDEKYKIKKGKKQIGIDLGIMNFLTDSENNKIDNPLFMNKSLDKLKYHQRNLSNKKKGSRNRIKTRNLLAKTYEKINNQKHDFFHKTTTKLISSSSLIAIEKLNIRQMMQTSYNARNMFDSSWNKFTSMLKLKAGSAGVSIIEVDPRNTTKECSSCGNKQDMPLYKRTYICNCGNNMDRDHNSAVNILNKALGLGRAFVEKSAPAHHEQAGSMKQEAISSTFG